MILLGLFLMSCTDNNMARQFGGKMTIVLPEGKRLVNATWKQDNLWYLIEDRAADQTPRKLLFQESSSFGVMEGTVTFVEQ